MRQNMEQATTEGNLTCFSLFKEEEETLMLLEK